MVAVHFPVLKIKKCYRNWNRYLYTSFFNGSFDASGNGTFTGQVNGNTLSMLYSGQDTVGGTCTVTGPLTVSR